MQLCIVGVGDHGVQLAVQEADQERQASWFPWR